MTTTTNDKALRRIIGLRDQARHASTGEAEAATFLAKALELCTKHGIDAAILDKPAQEMKKPIINGQAPQEKKYSCRFGCGLFVQHTIDELNACAAKAREAGGGNAYNRPRDRFEDLFSGFGFTEPRTGRQSSADAPKARATGSHAYCSHEATKAARARCRRERGY